MEKLYNLKYDFVKQDSNYIVFSKDKGLSNEQLNSIQVKMLLSNNIPNLLPLEIEEINFNIKLRYNVSSKKNLNNYLKIHELNAKESLQIFSNIVSIINDCKLYMFEEKNYIIHQDFLFIDSDTFNIFFIYLPLKNILEKESYQLELKKILLYILNTTKNIDANLYNKIIKYTENENFNISDIKQKLSLFSDTSDYEHNNNLENIDTKNELIDNNSLLILTRVQKKLLFLISNLLIIFIWSIYLENQKDSMFYISLGLTILTIDFTYVVLKIWRPSLKKITRNNVIEVSEGRNHCKDYVVKSDETILLKNIGKRIFLEVDRGTEVEKINIENQSFIIGRNKSAVHYLEKSSEISRVHLEIIEDSTGYLARDLGSKNKSYLNGDELVPNKVYPIKDSDVIRLANTEFIVREVLII